MGSEGVIVLPIRLVVFDADGTLTCHSSIWWRLHEHFRTEKLGKTYFGQFFAGEITYNQWAELDAGLWKGQPVEEVMRVVAETRTVPGAQETIALLKEQGIQVAILSGGLDILADDIGRRVGIEYVLTNRLLISDGILTGGVEVKVGWGEKIHEIREILDHFGVSLSETAYVGDGKNDMTVFSHVGLSIAFRPETEEVSEAAMITIKGNDLRHILEYIV